MPTKIRHEVTAPKGRDLTLDELAAFVEAARALGIPGDAVPTAKIRTFSTRVYALAVTSTSTPAEDGER